CQSALSLPHLYLEVATFEPEADWAAAAEVAALDWYEQSWTTDVDMLEVSMPDLWNTAMGAAETSQQSGASVQAQLLAAAEAARAQAEALGLTSLQQARQSGLAAAEVARRRSLALGLAAQAAEQANKQLGEPLAKFATMFPEVQHNISKAPGPRFSNFDLQEIWTVAMNAAERTNGTSEEQILAAAQAAKGLCASRGYNASGQARMSSLAAGEVARHLTGDQMLRADAASDAATQVTSSLGLGASQSATEAALARKMATAATSDEVTSLVREATAGLALGPPQLEEAQMQTVEADAAAVLSAHPGNQSSLLVGVGIGMAALFLVGSACAGLFLALKSKRPKKRLLDPEAEDEKMPLVTAEAPPPLPDGVLPGSAVDRAVYRLETRSFGTLPGAGASRSLDLPSGSLASRPDLTSSRPKEISYEEWSRSWLPGQPKQVIFEVPPGAKPGAALAVEVAPGLMMATEAPPGAYPGALARVQR
ncbi:unnamed protein product, partial [Effrenium voratum]